MLTLKVINFWAGPGAGKSTTSAGLFNWMKSHGYKVEYVTEFAKDLTYSKDYGSLTNQLYVLGEQDKRLRRLEGQVEWAITDSPLPIGLVYAPPEYGDWYRVAVAGAYTRYRNVDFLVRRKKPYATYGRNQTESEAVALDIQVRDLFKEFTACREDRTAFEIDGETWAPLQVANLLFEANGGVQL